MTIKDSRITRGHIMFELTDGRHVYVPGELTLTPVFYAVTSQDWYWVKEKSALRLLMDNDDIIRNVAPDEKDEIRKAVTDQAKEMSINIIFE